MSESERECVCGYPGETCQCQYNDWPAVENRHTKCDFCGKTPPTHELNGGLWWVCKGCYDIVHIRMEIVNKEEEEE